MHHIEIEDLLDDDARLVYEECGEDVLIALLHAVAGITISLKNPPLDEMRRRFILERGDDRTAGELAHMLDVPESFIEEVRSEAEEEGS